MPKRGATAPTSAVDEPLTTGHVVKRTGPPRDNLVRALFPGIELRSPTKKKLPPDNMPLMSAPDATPSAPTPTTGDEPEALSADLGTLVGHFAVFNTWTEIDSFWEGNFLERIAPGAFKKTFKENQAGIRVLFQHGQDPQVGDKPLGPITALREDPTGAYYEAQLLDTSYNRDLKPGLDANLYGASFKFRVMKEEFDQTPDPSPDNPLGLPERTIREAQVFEFGPVTFPAYPDATAAIASSGRAQVRSLTDYFVLGPEALESLMKAREAQRESRAARRALAATAPTSRSASDNVSMATCALQHVLGLIEEESSDAADDADPADPDADPAPDTSDDAADIATLRQIAELLTAYIASTVTEVGTPDDLEDIAEEANDASDYMWGRLQKDPLFATFKRVKKNEDTQPVAGLGTVATQPDALPSAGAEVLPHSEPRSRESQGTTPIIAAPETQRITARSEDHMPGTDDIVTPKTVDEIRERREAIERRLNDIHVNSSASPMTDDLRKEWTALIAERGQIDIGLDEHETRTKQIAAMSVDPRRLEHIGLSDRNRRPGAGADRVPNNVYAVEEYRALSSTPEDLNTALRTGAKRAVSEAVLPHPDIDEEGARKHVLRLLNRDYEGVLARRILATGSDLYQRAFGKALKSTPMSAEETRALALGSDADGGFAVPFQLDPTVILASNGVVNPIRQLARVEQIVGKEWQGVTSQGVVASYAGESDPSTDNSPTLVQPVVRTLRAQAFIPFSVEIGQDWGGLQTEMARLLADAKDVLEANKFITGIGAPTEPGGVVATLDAGSLVASANSGVFAVGDIYKTEAALAPRFRPTAVWLGNKSIFNLTRQFDVYGGASLWVRLLDKTPSELIGYPAYEASEMDSTTTTNKQVLVFGDFKQFLIADRIGMSVELIPHLFDQATGFPTGQRGIFAIWRNSTVILTSNAFRVLKIA